MQETQPVGFASQTKPKNKIKPIPETTSCKFMLTKYLAFQITHLEEQRTSLKVQINWHWDHSDVGNPDTIGALNSIRDELRYIKKQLQKLRYIQKVIKLFPDDELSLDYAKKYSVAFKTYKKFSDKPKKLDSHKVD
jgi:hypothetical protein